MVRITGMEVSRIRQLQQEYPQVWNTYLAMLDTVVRYQGMTPIRPGFQETDRGHIVNGLNTIASFRKRYPQLKQFIHLLDLEDLWGFHDGGEIHAGDVPKNDPRYLINAVALKEEKKRNERQGFFQLLTIFPSVFHQPLLLHFARFEEPHRMDTTAQFAHFIDILEGNTTAQLEYNAVSPTHPVSDERRKQVKRIGLHSILDQTTQTLKSAPEPRFEAIVGEIVSAHLLLFAQTGYEQESEEVLQLYPQVQRILAKKRKRTPQALRSAV